MSDSQLERVRDYLIKTEKRTEDITNRWNVLQRRIGVQRLAAAKDESYFVLAIALAAASQVLNPKDRERYLKAIGTEANVILEALDANDDTRFETETTIESLRRVSEIPLH